ncbi:MAG: protein kinase [Streptosporangiales bacterium]|nr:protein kinase [Streptosporangiales bacterium]
MRLDGLPDQVEPLAPDDPVAIGRYRLLGRLGSGGMGTVYLSEAEGSAAEGGGQVAVKVIRPELALDEATRARFRDEMEHARRVASFCTARVIEHGTYQNRPFMVTDYIAGTPLSRQVSSGGPLEPATLHGVALGVAAALAAIHGVGLVHRDLKPANVILSLSGPRVIDFGIARALDDARAGHTQTGIVMGSPGWMAPEQLLEERVTTAADIFAWGCLVVYAGTGKHPYGNGDAVTLGRRVLFSEPAIGDLPEPIRSLVQASLVRDPATRPTAQDLLLGLVGGGELAQDTNKAVSEALHHTWRPPGGRQDGLVGRPTASPVPPPPTQAPHGSPAAPGPPAQGPPRSMGVPPPAAGPPPSISPTTTGPPGGPLPSVTASGAPGAPGAGGPGAAGLGVAGPGSGGHPVMPGTGPHPPMPTGQATGGSPSMAAAGAGPAKAPVPGPPVAPPGQGASTYGARSYVPPAPPPSPLQRPTPGARRYTMIALLILVVLAVIATVVAIVTDNAPGSLAAVPPSGAPTVIDKQAQASPKGRDFPPKGAVVTVNDGGLRFAVFEPSCGRKMYGSLRANNGFCVIPVQVYNTGGKPATIKPELQRMRGTDRAWITAEPPPASLRRSESLWQEIGPGLVAKGYIVFARNRSTRPARLKLRASEASDGVNVTFD